MFQILHRLGKRSWKCPRPCPDCVCQVDYQTARQTCVCTEGADLAKVDSGELNTFLTSLVPPVSAHPHPLYPTWIGCNDLLKEGTFTWTDGTVWSDNWKCGGNLKEKRDCVALAPGGDWDCADCGTVRNFFCQKPEAGQLDQPANRACNCEAGWTASFDSGFCYKRGAEKKSYDEAKAACEANSANLASVTSETEDLVVRSVAFAGNRMVNSWLGATDTVSEGSWVWDDGTAWNYHNWLESSALGTAGGTEANCLSLTRAGPWDDLKCSYRRLFVCKK